MTVTTNRLPAWVLAAVLCSASMAFAQAASTPEGDAVRALELKRFEVMEKNDLAALSELLADDLVYAHSTGVVDSKAQYLEALKSGKTRYKRISPEQMTVRVFGDTAVIHGRARLNVENSGTPSEGILSFLDVWAKRNGRWQMVAWQSARMPSEAGR